MPDEVKEVKQGGPKEGAPKEPVKAPAPPPSLPSVAPPPPPSSQPEQVGLRVSLIPSEVIEMHDPEHGFRVWLAVTLAGAIIFGGVSGLVWYNTIRAKAEVRRLSAELDLIKKDEDAAGPTYLQAAHVQSLAKTATALLTYHRYPSALFGFLEKNTLKNVLYTNASITPEGVLSISATTTDYSSLAEQIVAFRRLPEVKSVKAESIVAGASEGGVLSEVRFLLTIAFDQKLFAFAAPPAPQPAPAPAPVAP